MKKLILFITYCSALFVNGQHLSVEQAIEDFQIFKNAIKDIHPGLYWHADSLEIADRFATLEKKLDQEIALKDYYGLLQKFYAGIRCGHSWMSMPSAWRKPTDGGPYRIPLNFYLESDRIFVFRDLTDDRSIGEGHEVLTINGVSVGEIMETLMQYTPTDGYARSRQINLLAGNFSRYYQVHYGMDSTFEITLAQGGSTRKVTLKGLPNKEANTRSIERYGKVKRSKKMLEYKMIDEQVSYLRISSLDKEEIKDGDQRYKPFIKRAFEDIADNNSSKLIIDLRGNPGGEDNYGATLAKYLLQEKFDYYRRMETVTRKFQYNEYSYQRGFNTMGKSLKKDKENPGTYTYNFSRQLKKQKPAKNSFKGNLIVLIDGGTFSAASEVASILHTNQRATFIGEETGGGYYGNNSAMMYGIELPRVC